MDGLHQLYNLSSAASTYCDYCGKIIGFGEGYSFMLGKCYHPECGKKVFIGEGDEN